MFNLNHTVMDEHTELYGNNPHLDIDDQIIENSNREWDGIEQGFVRANGRPSSNPEELLAWVHSTPSNDDDDLPF